MDNVQVLKDYLTKSNIRYEEGWLADGSAFFKAMYRLRTGDDVTLLFSFEPGGAALDITLLGLVRFDDPLKREKILNVLNELNAKYRYTKFFINNDGTVVAQTSLPTLSFHPENAVRLGLATLFNVEEEYPNIMRIRWA